MPYVKLFVWSGGNVFYYLKIYLSIYTVLSCVVLNHIWQLCGLKVGILGTQSPKYI